MAKTTEPWRKYRYTICNQAEADKAYNGILDQLRAEKVKYKQAKEQLFHYDQQFAELEYQHEQAEATKSHAERYSWKLQLSSLIYVRNLLHQFVKLKQEHQEIVKQHILEFYRPEKLSPNELLVDEFPLD